MIRATILAAALVTAAIAGTVTHSVTAKQAPELHPAGADTAITLPDGATIQTEYVGWYLIHRNDPNLVIFEDASPALIDCEAGTITGPNDKTYPFNCDR